MKISRYLYYILKDFFAATGSLMMVTAIFMVIYSVKTFNTLLLWQIILVASAYTFFKFSLVNKYELGKKFQMISFYICFVLADLMIILLLCSFSPGKSNDISHIIAYVITILIVKGLVYSMMYIDGRTQAKQLNEKLNQYKNDASE